jgi:tRNA threonylcarbamoyladenosine modification (KEOPS) complex Cgi121 subunit
MADATDNLVLEHLKRIQTEQTASRERDAEMLSRLAQIDTSIARLARDGADNFAEVIADRHAVDKLRDRIERIERRLELQT